MRISYFSLGLKTTLFIDIWTRKILAVSQTLCDNAVFFSLAILSSPRSCCARHHYIKGRVIGKIKEALNFATPDSTSRAVAAVPSIIKHSDLCAMVLSSAKTMDICRKSGKVV